MLVLRRKPHESVVVGDEVRVTVEEICNSDGERLYGASLQLGFQSPRYVSIFRDELCRKRSGAGHTSKAEKPAPRSGKLVEISDAVVRLRIQVPRKIPVCCNGTPSVGADSEDSSGSEPPTSKSVHHISCRKEDRITICNNITVATLNIERFIPSGDP